MTVHEFLNHLSASGIRLSVTDGKLKVDAPAGVLTNQQRAMIRERKAELITLLTPKLCERCNTAMALVEVGYYSCPSCYFQIVEAKSGFWVTGVEEEMRAAV